MSNGHRKSVQRALGVSRTVGSGCLSSKQWAVCGDAVSWGPGEVSECPAGIGCLSSKPIGIGWNVQRALVSSRATGSVCMGGGMGMQYPVAQMRRVGVQRAQGVPEATGVVYFREQQAVFAWGMSRSVRKWRGGHWGVLI